ncbi:hypothetical protein DER45DRAFT_409253 [Fusarium avenaceum]|nr:hypothetical protein DER45DRAFT_409253 [Fusarium avenaceum]
MGRLFTRSNFCCDCTLCGIKLDTMNPYDLEDEIYAESPPRWYPELWKQDNVALSAPCSYTRLDPFKTLTADAVGCDPVDDDTDERGSHRQVVLKHGEPPLGFILPQASNWDCPAHDRNLCFIVLHAPCLRIAKLVMDLSRDAHVSTLGDLWLTLERRSENVFKLENKKGRYDVEPPFIPAIPEDPPECRPATGPVRIGFSRYFVDADRVLGGVDDEDWEEECHGPRLTDRWWNDDPEHIPGLTSSLLSNLDEYLPSRHPLPTFRDRFKVLPQEIKDRILYFLPSKLPLACTYLLDQSYWYIVFLQVPFLWDLDLAMVQAKLGENTTDGQNIARQYDWEKLTRQVLTPMDVVDPEVQPPLPGSYARVGLLVPQGFQNRRRIWQIVEEMYPNDVRVDEN